MDEPLKDTEIYYDKKGRQIHEFDLLKVFHFRTKRKIYYMYKWVRVKNGHLYAWHLQDGEEKGYYLKGGGHKENVFSGTEIIQSPYTLKRELGI